MAIRFSADGEYLSRTSNVINANSAYTVMAWMYYIATSTSWTTPWMFGSTNYSASDYIQINNEPTRSFIQGVNGTETAVGTATASTWMHLAMVRQSTTSLVCYIDGAVTTATTTNVAARAATTTMQIGAELGGSALIDSRWMAVKAWSWALTANEILSEMRVIRPGALASLYGWWPMLPGANERVRDYSGNGYNWTEAGTLSDENPHFIAWGAPLWTVPYSSAVAVTGNPYYAFAQQM